MSWLINYLLTFQVADTRLFKPLFALSVGLSVRLSICPSLITFLRFSASAHPSPTNAAVYTALFTSAVLTIQIFSCGQATLQQALSICPFVCLLVHQSIGLLVSMRQKVEKTVFPTLPTRPQQRVLLTTYCPWATFFTSAVLTIQIFHSYLIKIWLQMSRWINNQTN